jgi:hypothetical protein
MKIAGLLLMACALGLLVAAQAQDFPSGFSEISRIGTLKDWKNLPPHKWPHAIDFSWVPAGQTDMEWSEMVTVTTFKNDGVRTPRDIGAQVIGQMSKGCGQFKLLAQNDGTQTDPVRQEAGLPADYPTFMMAASCQDPIVQPQPGLVIKKYEIIWSKIMLGHQAVFSVTRDWHSDDNTAPDTVATSPSVHQAWLDWFNEAEIMIPPKAATHAPP